MPTRTALYLATLILLAASCKSPKVIPANGTPPASDTLIGEYRGELPCADCPGIDYKLELYDNYSFRESSLYLERSDTPYVESGNWRVANGKIALEKGKQKSLLKIGSHTLTLLDSNGKEIEPPMGEHFILKKSDTDSTETGNLSNPHLSGNWQVIQLGGKAIDAAQMAGGPPALEFFPAGGYFQGYGGCNRISGKMGATANTLYFGMVRSTKMACPELETESELLHALTNGSYDYAFDELQLVLSKEGETRMVLRKVAR